MFHRTILLALTGLAVAGSLAAFGGCSDDTATNNNPTVFTPGGSGSPDGGGSTTATSGGPGDTTTDGGCPNKPAGCFCGNPTTQAQWLNRCTTAAALPVNLTVKPATTADIP